MNEVTQSFFQCLERVRQQGAACRTRCPAHNDKTPSLSIGLGADNRLLLNCHAGCSVEAIVSAVGLTLRDLFSPARVAPQSVRSITMPTKQPASPRGGLPRDLEREANFSRDCRDDLSTNEDALAYLWRRRGIGARTASDWGVGITDAHRDASGAIIGATWTLPILSHLPTHPLIGIKLHRDPPPQGQAKGGWLVRGGAALFPLPEAQSLSPGAQIILVEGELKALTYVEAGLAATSPTTGAATRWTADMANRFAGLAVVIDPDREDSKAARDFVSHAVRALSPVAHSIAVCGT